jgi:hypothetical protein
MVDLEAPLIAHTAGPGRHHWPDRLNLELGSHREGYLDVIASLRETKA